MLETGTLPQQSPIFVTLSVFNTRSPFYSGSRNVGIEQVSFVPELASAHAVPQCLLPSAAAQLQAGCAHFVVGVIEVLLRHLLRQASSRGGKRTLGKLSQHCIGGSNNLFRFAHRGHPLCN